MSQTQSTNSDFNEDEDDEEEEEDMENCDNSVGESEDGKKCDDSAKKINETQNEKTSMFSKNFYKLISQNSQLQEQFHQYSLANFQNSEFFKNKKPNSCANSPKSLNQINNKPTDENDVADKCDNTFQYTTISPQTNQGSLENFSCVNNLATSQAPLQMNQGLLAQFMSPATFAAAMFCNPSKPNNLLVPINPNSVSIYQKNYLEALNFYKAACNGNGINVTPTN